MRQIVCISTSPWEPIPTRKQQLMRRLPDAEILYFDPPVSWLSPWKDPAAREKLNSWKAGGKQVTDSVRVFSLPPVLPMYHLLRTVNRLNQKRLADFIGKRMRENGFSKPLLWCYSPTSCDLVDRIEHSGLIYDCVDRHSAYGGLMKPELVDQMEAELAKKADLVLATTEGLAERLKEYNSNVHTVPNGAEYDLFSKASERQPLPSDFPVSKGPVFGFLGALQPCIAYDYAAYAARMHPDWSFVILGEEKPGAALEQLKKLPNCHFPGRKPYRELPVYMAQCDVLLNLFSSSALSEEVSPLKFYEYLCTGKPIVSTRQPKQTLRYRDLIEIADSKEDFVRACQRALADTDPKRKKARMTCGQACSWENRTKEILALLKEYKLF